MIQRDVDIYIHAATRAPEVRSLPAAAGLLFGRFVESQLFGVKAAGPPVFLISVVALLDASLSAAFTPAWRASRINPIRALRHK